MPTLHQLQIFVHVARHLNVTKAAKELKISQPSVSRHLKALESLLGTKLFQKTNTGIQLTDHGRRCLVHAEAVVRQIELMREELSDESPQSKRLTVGGTYSVSALLLPAAITEFKRTHPQIDIELRTAHRSIIEKMVLSSKLQIGIVTGAATSPELIAEPFRRRNLVFFASKSYPIKSESASRLEVIEKFPLIVREGHEGKGTADRLLRQVRSRGLKPNIALRCDSLDSVKAAVQKGLGLGIIYRDVIQQELNEGKFKVVKFKGITFFGRSFIIYNRASSLTHPAADFLSLLRSWRGIRSI